MARFHYLIDIQYLGFRYHGWQKQPGVKTVEAMVEKTLNTVLGHGCFKVMGASRTDAKVSANHSGFMLFVDQAIEPLSFLAAVNHNLPNDIRVTNAVLKDKHFNILNSPRIKEYLYLFSAGCKHHPFCAAMMACFLQPLDIDLMQQGAKRFEGRHDFVQYCTKPGEKTRLVRDIQLCRIEENSEFTANFFPERSYLLRVKAKGFLRYQIRLIMGQLVCLGEHLIDLDEIEASLSGLNRQPLRQIAPASGLILNKITF